MEEIRNVEKVAAFILAAGSFENKITKTTKAQISGWLGIFIKVNACVKKCQ